MDEKHAKLLLLSKQMVENTLKAFEKQRKEEGSEFAASLTMAFIASLVGSLAYRALSEEDPNAKTKKAKLEFAKENFTSVKTDVCDALATGVGGAMTEFSGQQVDYYCSLKIVPPPINELEC